MLLLVGGGESYLPPPGAELEEVWPEARAAVWASKASISSLRDSVSFLSRRSNS